MRASIRAVHVLEQMQAGKTVGPAFQGQKSFGSTQKRIRDVLVLATCGLPSSSLVLMAGTVGWPTSWPYLQARSAWASDS